jgi:simple sugar transport system ATP-binding protein
MVHQHFTLVPSFTVEENLALMKARGWGLDVSALAAPALETAHALGWEVNAKARVRDLSVGAQQRVEILKAMSGDEQVLLFDEPTAPLSRGEVTELLGVLRRLAEEGRIVILIAHKLDEVLAVADRISVLRRGRLVWHGPRSEATAAILAQEMVGEMPMRAKIEAAIGTELVVSADRLEVRAERGEIAVRGVTLSIRRGEILGIGGVDGNGQVELAEALAGVRHPSGGVLRAPEAGYIPGDRQGEGLAMGLNVGENLALGAARRPEIIGRFLLKLGRLRDWAKGLIERYAIKVDGPGSPIAGLSGGNQQKVVVSRVLDAAPRLVVAVNPTRGLDLKATEFVHEQLRLARAGGAAVALVSADLDELADLADRVVYMSRGELAEGEGPLAVVGGS